MLESSEGVFYVNRAEQNEHHQLRDVIETLKKKMVVALQATRKEYQDLHFLLAYMGLTQVG